MWCCGQNSKHQQTCPVAEGGFVDWAPPNKAPSLPPHWNMKHYDAVEFSSNFQNVKPFLHKRKDPFWRLSGDGSATNPCVLVSVPHSELWNDIRDIRQFPSFQHFFQQPSSIFWSGKPLITFTMSYVTLGILILQTFIWVTVNQVSCQIFAW